MTEFKTPGVYIQEIPNLPPSIVSVETAIPVFVGYTEFAKKYVDDDLIGTYFRIQSPLEYQIYFGGPPPEPASAITVTFDATSGTLDVQATVDEKKRSKYLLYYSLQMFFNNGGGTCYIYSAGKYVSPEIAIDYDLLNNSLAEIRKESEITLLVFPDAMNLVDGDKYYQLHTNAIQQCVDLQNRFVVMDVFRSIDKVTNKPRLWSDDIDILRVAGPTPPAGTAAPAGISGNVDFLKYAAVYFPRLVTLVTYNYKPENVSLNFKGDVSKILNGNVGDFKTMAELNGKNNGSYNMAKTAVDDLQMLLPASSSVVGVYTQVDNSRGVWKAPANVNIQSAVSPELFIADIQQDTLNVDQVAGKSINVIRYFTGRGSAFIWGARTLAGNDNEWRYVPVRRFFIMVEQSVKNATEQFVFEPNDENTWIRVKSMIQNYLTQQWKAGALMGASVKEAFYVHIGLGQTMTEVDVWEGRMIIQIGMAVVRPAEFIILQFMHKMLSES